MPIRKRQVRPRPHEKKPEGLRPSRLTQPGPAVKNLLGNLKSQNTMSKILELGRKLAKIPVMVADDKTLREKYGKRTAEQILRDNVVYATPQGHEKLIEGCVDYATVSVACLRALGVPAWFVRDRRHSYAIFDFQEQRYRFDPQRTYKFSEEAVARHSDISAQEERLLATARRQGRYFVGHDPHDIGLDFETYDLPTNEKKKVR